MPALVARTGYTGEDGFELFVDGRPMRRASGAKLLEAGKPYGLEPAGLGARDVLRLEAGMPLYGHELTEESRRCAGGQSWAVKLTKPAFTRQGGAGGAGRRRRLRPDRRASCSTDESPARDGYPVYLGDEQVGEVRSGSIAPSCRQPQHRHGLRPQGRRNARHGAGVEIRGTKHPAAVVPFPFYKRPQ